MSGIIEVERDLGASVVDWAAKPEPWRTVGLGFVAWLRQPEGLPKTERQEKSWISTPAGRRLREARHRTGLSARALGHRAGVPRTRVSAIESGMYSLSPAMAERLAPHLGVSAGWLISGIEGDR